MLQAIKAKDHISHHKRRNAVLATCFCCKKKYKAGKNQHSKYSLCPVCKKYKAELEKGELWVDCELLLPKKSYSRWD